MKLLQQNWGCISSHMWAFATLAGILFAAGWSLARLFYSERIELLKERTSPAHADSAKTGADAKFAYKSNGRHGPNVLAGTTHDAALGQRLSFQALIPDNQKLHVVLHGSPPSTPGDNAAAWYFNVVGVTNWVADRYQESTSTQRFNAEAGLAEMQFHFGRVGDVRIEVFEGDSPTVTWSKTIRVSGAGTA